MKTIALTGATSMTGLALIKQCIKRNTSVIAFVRPDSGNIYRLPESSLIKPVECSLENIGNFNLPESCSKADVFYHIGWVNNSREKRGSCRLQAENIPYAIDTVQMAKKMQCSRYIFLGSQAEVGLTNKPINPETFINPVSADGIANYAAGKITGIECNAQGLEHIWVRLVSEYGPHDHKDRLIKQFIKNCKNGIPIDLGDCTKIWDYLYEDDAGEALYLIGLKGHNGKMYTLGSGTGRPQKEYLEIIKNKINPEYRPNYGAKKSSENDILYLAADISELSRDTGWQPKVSFEEGIDAVIKEVL